MRACNGCRKRKIKCDAATTNTWPCSACTRLKLVCVPPTIGQDGDLIPEGQGIEPSPDPGGPSSAPESSHAFPVPPAYSENPQPTLGTMPSYDGMGMYSQLASAPQSQPGIYPDMRPPPMDLSHPTFQQPIFSGTHAPPLETTERATFVDREPSTAEDLSDVLGELKIDETGIGMNLHTDPIQLQTQGLN